MRCQQNKVVDAAFKRWFYKMGFMIGEHPGYFIVVPLLLTALCASGFQQMIYNYDPEYLFSPSDGEAKSERAVLEHYFKVNYSDFKASRLTRPGKFGRVVISAKDGGSMLNETLWNQLLYLDQVVYNLTVEHEGSELNYEQLCAHWNNFCYDNDILRLAYIIPNIVAGELNITYPIFFNPYNFESYTLPAYFGGVSLTEENTIIEVKAIALSYFLDVSEDWRLVVGDKWERKFLEHVEKYAEIYYPDLEVGMFVSNTPAWEMEKSKLSVTWILCINVGLMVAFSFAATSMGDAAKSKPLVGFGGLVSALLATIAGFGFCCYAQVKFISLNMAAPFLLLGIGLDDTYVLLSSWRRLSSHQLSVPERMGLCFSDAAVSITVTSLTDFFGFLAGVVTPFPSVRIFCLYSGISVAFIYVWHLTLFGGFLAIAGYAEKDNRHGLLCCLKVTPKSQSKDKSWAFRTFMTGGINKADPYNPEDNKDHVGMAFIRDHLGGPLNKTWVKCIVLIVFAAYLVVASWGITNIKEGLEKRNTANYDSYSVKYYDMDDAYFKEYAYAISVVFSGPNLDLSNKETRKKVESITQALENSTYIDPSVTQSWLRDFLDYLKRNDGYTDVHLPVDSPKDFANTLKNIYLADASNPAKLDVAFNEDNTKVVAARFLIQGHHINSSVLEQRMVAELRDICRRYSTDDFSVTVFQPFFIYIDQYLAILPQTIQAILATAVVMIIIALILIPSFVASLWVSISIVSIEIGVLGYMTWWGVRLDGVALINLIMCIGFSVDFSAHICYHYLTEVGKKPDERIRASLYALGLPIIQGAVSTILGVIGLAFAPSYLFVTFFKMIFLVILLGLLHGMILLPVLLSLFGPGMCSSSKNSAGSSSKSTRSSSLSTPNIAIISGHRKEGKVRGIKSTSVLSLSAAAAAHSAISADSGCCSYTVNLGYHHDEVDEFRQQPQQRPVHLETRFPTKSLTYETSTTEQSSPSASSTSSRVKIDSNPGHKSKGGSRTQTRPSRYQIGDQHNLHRKVIGHQHQHHHAPHYHHQNLHLGSGNGVAVVNGPRSLAHLAASGEFQTSTPRSGGLVRTTGLASVVENAGPEHDKLESQLAAISRMKRIPINAGPRRNNNNNNNSSSNNHRKVGRSRSHMPSSTEWSIPLPPTLAEHQQQLQEQLAHVSSNPAGLTVPTGVPKPPLKKHHSFPYEMFQNDTTSYSSEGEEDFQDMEAIRRQMREARKAERALVRQRKISNS